MPAKMNYKERYITVISGIRTLDLVYAKLARAFGGDLAGGAFSLRN